MEVFSALHARISKRKVVLSQAPRDKTLEYPHGILSNNFLGDNFFDFAYFFQFLNQKFSKNIANLGILFIVMNSTHLNASKLVIKSQKAFNKFWFVDQFNSIFFMKSERVYTINTITIQYLDVGGVWCTIWRMKP